jgi:cell wall-associated NlpC family hydrolase
MAKFMKNKSIIILLLTSFFSLITCAADAQKVVMKPYTSSLTEEPTANNNMLQPYIADVIRTRPGSPERFRQIDQFLMNEVLTVTQPALWPQVERRIDGDFVSGGIVNGQDLGVASPFYLDLLTHVVNVPVLKVGSQELSMGTKLQSGGEMEGKLGVTLPDGTIAFVPESSLWALRDLIQLSGPQIRSRVIERARLLLGQPYQWGGRSALPGAGFDCSGLVNIAYLTSGMEIVRGIGQMRQAVDLIPPTDLQPGDLLFSMKGLLQPVHVVIWTGAGTVIEASPSSMTVREASIEVVFGKTFDQIKYGQVFYESGADTYHVDIGRLKNFPQ